MAHGGGNGISPVDAKAKSAQEGILCLTGRWFSTNRLPRLNAMKEANSPAGPAYRIQTPRLVLRCWDPTDAPLLSEALAESIEHLKPWMPWVHEEPKAVTERVQTLRRFRGQFDLNKDFVYGIFSPDESAVLGGSGLHTRVGEGIREIGFWIRARETGKGYATEATMALTRVAILVDKVRRVEVRCDPKNERSAAVARKAGFQYEGTLRGATVDVSGEARDTMVWSQVAVDYDVATELQVSAFDACGSRLL